MAVLSGHNMLSHRFLAAQAAPLAHHSQVRPRSQVGLRGLLDRQAQEVQAGQDHHHQFRVGWEMGLAVYLELGNSEAMSDG